MNVTELKNTQITEAFRQASQEFPEAVKLRGRGHEPRVVLTIRASQCAAKGCKPTQWDKICGGKNFGPRRVFPLQLVKKAAETLGVPPEELISPSWREGER